MSTPEAMSCTDIPMVPANLEACAAVPEAAGMPPELEAPEAWVNFRVLGRTIMERHRTSRAKIFDRALTIDDMIGIYNLYALGDVPNGERELPKIEAYLLGKSYASVAELLNNRDETRRRIPHTEQSVTRYFEKDLPKQVFTAIRQLTLHEQVVSSGNPKTGVLSNDEREKEIAAILAADTGRHRGGAFSIRDFASLFGMTEKEVWNVWREEMESGRFQRTETPRMLNDSKGRTGHYYGQAATVMLAALRARKSYRDRGSSARP